MALSPPRLVPLGEDHRRAAVGALAALLAPFLHATETGRPSHADPRREA